MPIQINGGEGNAAQIVQKKLYDQPFSNLEKRIEYRIKRQSVISSNIANINTPNYKAFDLIMNEKLKEPKIVPTNSPIKNDGNSVDLDMEMSKLTKNQLMFKMLTMTIAKRFEQLRSVIAEGRR